MTLFTALSISVAANAGIVCKISNDNDNVEVYSAALDGGTVKVTVGNDSQNIAANVTVRVKVAYCGNISKEFSSVGYAKPNGTSVIEIPVDREVLKPNCLGTNCRCNAQSVEVISISGTKCQ